MNKKKILIGLGVLISLTFITYKKEEKTTIGAPSVHSIWAIPLSVSVVTGATYMLNKKMKEYKYYEHMYDTGFNFADPHGN